MLLKAGGRKTNQKTQLRQKKNPHNAEKMKNSLLRTERRK